MGLIKDHLKCLYANKVSLTGVLVGVSSLVYNDVFYQPNHTNLFVDICTNLLSTYSTFSLVATSFGSETYNSYLKTKRYLKSKKGNLDRNFIELMSRNYCSRKGLELALKENKE